MAPFLMVTSSLSAQEPPADFGKPDTEVKIGVLPSRMKYDSEWFAVKPGSKVKLTLDNPDVMQHNLVICKPGKDIILHIAQATAALGEDAIKKQFIPDIPEVLFHTHMVDPGEKHTIYFTAPAAEGEYPFVCTFPGHSLVMNGIMTVSKTEVTRKEKPPEAKPPVHDTPAAGRPGDITVKDQARVFRVRLPDTSASSMAVGLVGEFNYCFDAQTGGVRYGWTGPFINMAPELDGRGGQICGVLGKRFKVGYVDFPLRIGTNDKPAVKFLGYRMKEIPELLFSVDGVTVTLTVEMAPDATADSPALLYTFSIPRTKNPVRFLSNPAESRITSPVGTPTGGVLSIPAKDAAKFTITVKPA